MEKFGLYLGDVADAFESDPMNTVIEESYQAILQNIRDNFTSSVTPGGDPWPERKIEGDGHPLLMDTGALLQAATGGGAGHIVVLEPRALEFGVSADTIPYAASHEFGYMERNLPARSYLGAGKETLAEIGEEMADEGELFF